MFTERQIDNRAKKLEALEAEIKALEEQAEAVKNELKAELEEQNTEELKTISGYVIRWKLIKGSRLDGKALKANYPDIYSIAGKERGAAEPPPPTGRDETRSRTHRVNRNDRFYERTPRARNRPSRRDSLRARGNRPRKENTAAKNRGANRGIIRRAFRIANKPPSSGFSFPLERDIITMCSKCVHNRPSQKDGASPCHVLGGGALRFFLKNFSKSPDKSPHFPDTPTEAKPPQALIFQAFPPPPKPPRSVLAVWRSGVRIPYTPPDMKPYFSRVFEL